MIANTVHPQIFMKLFTLEYETYQSVVALMYQLISEKVFQRIPLLNLLSTSCATFSLFKDFTYFRFSR